MSTVHNQLGSAIFPTITYHNRGSIESFSIPASAGTLEGFREWALSDEFPERGKITFVAGGLIVDMSPESLEKHSEIKTEICRVLSNLVRDQKLGRLHIDGVLITNVTAGVSNEPDALFLSRQTIKSDRIKLTPAKNDPESSMEIVGTVDWVLEIVSPSSIKKDKVLLRKAYYESGIGEYWLVDALGDQVEFEILVPGDKEYEPVPPQDGWLASPTFGKRFKLERDKDEDGFWQYTLHLG
ncbi:MAG: Uma2 family endonuclease [Planctomycetes bacterium]|nr:Uma2 family endonuclease [Planctomycetota bacterium]